jgi:hypothetical protein
MRSKISRGLRALGACAGLGLASLVACGGIVDDKKGSLLTGPESSRVDAGATADAGATEDAEPFAPPAVAVGNCWSAEMFLGTQSDWGGYVGAGPGPTAISVAQPSAGHFVVSATEADDGGTSLMSFHAVSPDNAVADPGQVVSAGGAPEINNTVTPLPVSITGGMLSAIDGTTFIDLTGTAASDLSGMGFPPTQFRTTYVMVCFTPTFQPAPIAPAAAPVVPDPAIARVFTRCVNSNDSADVDPRGGTVQLAIFNDTVTVFVSNGTFAQASVAFTTDSPTTGVLDPGQQATFPAAQPCDPNDSPADTTGPNVLSSGNFAVVDDVVYVNLLGLSLCGKYAELTEVCQP